MANMIGVNDDGGKLSLRGKIKSTSATPGVMEAQLQLSTRERTRRSESEGKPMVVVVVGEVCKRKKGMGRNL